MFSVVIPAYNCGSTIEIVLDSVINQTRFDLIEEIIIINDGSTDCTEKVVLNYINNHKDLNIIYEYQDNLGVSKTRNKAINKSKAEWIALIDADDIWLPNKIEVQAEVIKANPQIQFLGSQYPVKIFFKKKYGGLIKITPKQLCFRNMPSTPSVVFNRKKGIELGLFDENQKYGEDIRFFQKFMLIDSYYILVKDLIRISIGKEFFAQAGLSSNLKKMHEGRNACVKELKELGLISVVFMSFILFINEFKYIRRVIQKKWNILKYNLLKKY